MNKFGIILKRKIEYDNDGKYLKMTFFLTKGVVLYHTLYFKKVGVPKTLHLDLFKSLNIAEIEKLFGEFDLNEKDCFIANGGIYISIDEKTKKRIRKITSQFLGWFEKGLKKCQEEEEKRDLKNWIYPEVLYKI